MDDGDFFRSLELGAPDGTDTAGQITMIDFGLPIGFQADLLHSHRRLVNKAKLAGSLAGAIDRQFLCKKLSSYRNAGIQVLPGGLFAEVAILQNRFSDYVADCAALGFTAIEVSSIKSGIGLQSKYEAITLAKKVADVHVIGEVGLHERKMSPSEILDDVSMCLEVGADSITLEAFELYENGLRSDVVGALLHNVPAEKLVFELPMDLLPEMSKSKRVDVLQALVGEFGAGLNFGNVEWDELYLVEMIRRGIAHDRIESPREQSSA